MSTTAVARFTFPRRTGRPLPQLVRGRAGRICRNRICRVADKSLRIHQMNHTRQTSAAAADRPLKSLRWSGFAETDASPRAVPKIGVGGHKWVGSSTIAGALWRYANHTEIH